MIFINQLREKIGVMFGSPETTTGGKALKFYSSVRLDVRRIETLKDGTDMVGNRTRVKVVKNKCLAEGSLVHDPVTGFTHRIEDVVEGQLPIHVMAADMKGHLHFRPVVSWFDQGEQEVLGLRVKGGQEIWVTPDHRILTEHGWVEAGDLGPGAMVACVPNDVQSASARLVGAAVGEAGHSPLAAFDGQAEAVEHLPVTEVLPRRTARTFDVEVDELHNLVANGLVVHNCAPPFKQAEFDIMYGKGISREGGLIDVGVEAGLVRKAGAWYTYEGDQLGQGKENARSFLKDNPDLANELEKKILERLGVTPQVDAPGDVSDELSDEPIGVDSF
jgi:hypothetical protein